MFMKNFSVFLYPAGEAVGVSAAIVADFPRERSDLHGKCDSRERSESEHRRCVADFPGFSRFEKCDSRGRSKSEH